MRIAKRGGHCLKAIYLNLSELNIRFLIKHSGSVAGKFRSRNHQKASLQAPEEHETSTNSSVHNGFQQRTYWSEWNLLIPRESPGFTNFHSQGHRIQFA